MATQVKRRRERLGQHRRRRDRERETAGRRACRNACRLTSVRGSTRTARIVTRSRPSCSSGRVSSSSKRDVSTSASPRSELADRLAQEDRLPRLRFDHSQVKPRRGERERNRRASRRRIRCRSRCSASGGTWRAATSGSISRRSMASSWPPARGERRQVDLRVPLRQERVIALEPIGELRRADRPAALPARRRRRSRNSRALIRGPPDRLGGSASHAGAMAEERAEHGDGGRCRAGNPQRLTQRLGPHLREALDQLARQAGDPLEREIPRESRVLLPAAALDRLASGAADSPRT